MADRGIHASCEISNPMECDQDASFFPTVVFAIVQPIADFFVLSLMAK